MGAGGGEKLDGELPLANVPCKLNDTGAEAWGAGDGEEYEDMDGDTESVGAKGLLDLRRNEYMSAWAYIETKHANPKPVG